jgi:S-adenosylmethionine/arginine decarboxylase-like enzyme
MVIFKVSATHKVLNDKELIENFKNTNAWGMAVSIDLANCNPKTIRNPTKLKEFIIKICDNIDMTRYGEPLIERFGEDERVSGYSIVQLIQTSCISGHFIEGTNGACIDIFSCKSYPPGETAKFCKDFFEATNARFTVLNRYCD